MRNLLGFVEQRKKMEADSPTVQVGATPTELTATPPPYWRVKIEKHTIYI